MFGLFPHPGVAGTHSDQVFRIVQEFLDLRDIGRDGRRTHDARHQAGHGIGTEVSRPR